MTFNSIVRLTWDSKMRRVLDDVDRLASPKVKSTLPFPAIEITHQLREVLGRWESLGDVSGNVSRSSL